MEGLTQQQAAGQLGWPIGTLQSRLARGRERLRGRLGSQRRGASDRFAGIIYVDGWIRGNVFRLAAGGNRQGGARILGGQNRQRRRGWTALSSLTHRVLKAMFLHDLRLASVAVLAVAVSAAGVGVWARQKPGAGLSAVPPQTTRADEPVAGAEFEDLTEAGEPEAAPAGDNVASLTYGDGMPDGKRSLGGSGELIQFSAPAATVKVSGVRIHGSRYGQAMPRESFLIYFLNEELTRILHTEMASYSLFERGPEGWVAVSFERPVELPKTFWIALDFRAAQTKGVFVSFDSSTGGKHSRAGLPGMRTSNVTFGGDWMIEASLAK